MTLPSFFFSGLGFFETCYYALVNSQLVIMIPPPEKKTRPLNNPKTLRRALFPLNRFFDQFGFKDIILFFLLSFILSIDSPASFCFLCYLFSSLPFFLFFFATSELFWHDFPAPLTLHAINPGFPPHWISIYPSKDLLLENLDSLIALHLSFCAFFGVCF